METGLRKWNFFWCQVIFFMNYDFKNGCRNEFKDNNEKSWSWSENSVAHKIDLKAVWPCDGHAASVGVKKYVLIAKKPLFNIIFTEFHTSGQTVFF